MSRRPARHAAGSAVVELAMSLPVLALVLVGTIDFARVLHTGMVLTSAARAGAQYGSRSASKSTDTAGMSLAATTAAQTDLGTIAVSTPARICQCVSNTDGATRSTASTCSASDCTSSYHLAITVTVTASQTFTTLSRYPGVPRTLAISRTVKMRAQ